MTSLEVAIERLHEARQIAQELEQETLIYLIDLALLEAVAISELHIETMV